MAWLLILFLLALASLASHVSYRWRGEEREWQGPFYKDEWPMEVLQPASPIRTLGKCLYYCLLTTCLGLLAYLLTQ